MADATVGRWGRGRIVQRPLDVDGDARRYALYVPPDLDAGGTTVVVLHGYGGSADDARLYGMEIVADRERFALAYAEAPAGEWNIGHEYRNADAAVHRRDDIACLDAVIADLPLALQAPPGLVAMLGVSMGGMMGVSYAAARPGRLAAIAGVISGMTNRQPASMGPVAAVPYLLVIGEDDRLLPPDRGLDFAVPGRDGQPLWLLAYEETLSHWARWNGFDGPPVLSIESDGGEGASATLTRQVWSRGGRETVVGCRIRPLGHRWPGLLKHPREFADPSLSAKLGPACAWPEGAELVWRFLQPQLVQR